MKTLVIFDLVFFTVCVLLPSMSIAYGGGEHSKGKSILYYDEEPSRPRYSRGGRGAMINNEANYVTRREEEVVPGYKRKVYVELPERIEKAYQPIDRRSRARLRNDEEEEAAEVSYVKKAPKVTKVVTFEDGGRQFYSAEDEAAERAARGGRLEGRGQPLKTMTRNYDIENMSKLSGPLKNYLSAFYESTKAQEALAGKTKRSEYMAPLEPTAYSRSLSGPSHASSYYPSSLGRKRHDDGDEEIIYGNAPSSEYNSNRNYGTGLEEGGGGRGTERRPTYYDHPNFGQVESNREEEAEEEYQGATGGRGGGRRQRSRAPPRENSMTLSYEPGYKKFNSNINVAGYDDEDVAEVAPSRGRGERRGDEGDEKRSPMTGSMLADEPNDAGEEESGDEEQQTDEYGGRSGNRRKRPTTSSNDDEDEDGGEQESSNKIERPKMSYYSESPEPNEETIHMLGNSGRHHLSSRGPYESSDSSSPHDMSQWKTSLARYAQEFGFEMPEQTLRSPPRDYRPPMLQDYAGINWQGTQRVPTFEDPPGTTTTAATTTDRPMEAASETKSMHESMPAGIQMRALPVVVVETSTNGYGTNHNRTTNAGELRSILKNLDNVIEP